MSGVLSGRVSKKRPNRPSGQVLRMMAIMQDGNSGEVPKEFLEGGRTGRRNAMPDILNAPDAHASTADLPARLQELATSGESKAEIEIQDPKSPQPGPSNQPEPPPDKDDAQKASGS